MISCLPILPSSQKLFWPQDNAIRLAVKSTSSAIGRLAFCLFAVIFAISGCAQHHTAESAELSSFHAGSLHLPDNAAAPRRIYLDCREGASLAPHLADQLALALKNGRFRLIDSPSNAGYILHVNILKRGAATPESLKAAVNAGYGSAVRLAGKGGEAIVADAILVQRKVPDAARSSQRKLKNISVRNALGSSRMRIGVLASGRKVTANAFSAAIARELAQRVEK